MSRVDFDAPELTIPNDLHKVRIGALAIVLALTGSIAWWIYSSNQKLEAIVAAPIEVVTRNGYSDPGPPPAAKIPSEKVVNALLESGVIHKFSTSPNVTQVPASTWLQLDVDGKTNLMSILSARYKEATGYHNLKVIDSHTGKELGGRGTFSGFYIR